MRSVVVAIVGFRCAQDIATCVGQLALSEHRAMRVHICENGGAESFSNLVAAFANDPNWIAGGSHSPATARVLECRTFLPRDATTAVRELTLHQAAGNLGFAAAVNEILVAIRDDPDWSAVWLLNPDTEPRADALSRMLARCEARTVGIVGARLVFKHSGRVQLYGGRWRRWLGRGFNIGLNCESDASVNVAAIEREQTYVSGASMLVTREFIETVGLMHEDYFLYAEEIDWCLRRGQFRLGYAHDAVVIHAHGTSIGSSNDRRRKSPMSVYFDERARLLLTRRFFPQIFPVVMLTTLVLTVQYARGGSLQNFVFALRGWWAGLRGETGFPDAIRARLERLPRSA
ncbi:hypothetical protein [Methylobacterium sp. A54F]